MPNQLRCSFSELNYIFNLNSAVERDLDFENQVQTIQTLPYEKTKSEFSFSFEDKEIRGEFGIVQKFSYYSTEPLSLNCLLSLEFEQNKDINFIIKIYGILKRVFSFLCYRRNIEVGEINLYGENEENHICPLGNLHILFDEFEYLEDKEIFEKAVKYDNLKEHFSDLVQAFSDNQVYFEHIPETYFEGQKVTVARTILLTAAFEWTFQQYYGDIPLSQYRLDVKMDILECLEQLKVDNEYNRKKRDELKHYSKIIENVDRNLSEKLLIALDDCDSILSPFISRIFSLNMLSVPPYVEIANDLQQQRNAFAHGDIDKDLKENIVLDVVTLEWLNYCLVLKQVGYDEVDIFNIINQVFQRNFKKRKKEDE